MLMIKHHPGLDMVWILTVYFEYFSIIVDVSSTDNVDKDNDPTSDTDGETQTHHSISEEGI